MGAELLIILRNGLFALAEMALMSALRPRLQHAARAGGPAARKVMG